MRRKTSNIAAELSHKCVVPNACFSLFDQKGYKTAVEKPRGAQVHAAGLVSLKRIQKLSYHDEIFYSVRCILKGYDFRGARLHIQ